MKWPYTAFAAFACSGCLGTAALAEPPPVADFFRQPVISNPVLSPSGKYLAATMASGADRRRRLVMVDFGDIDKSKVIAGFGDADVRSVHWVNDQRLVFSVVDNQSAGGDQFGEGLFSIDREGKEAVRWLIKRRWNFFSTGSQIADRQLSPNHRLGGVLRDGSDDVIVRQDHYSAARERTSVSLSRLNTVTGVNSNLSQGAPSNAVGWAIDARGQPRVAETLDHGKSRLYLKPTPDADWKLFREQQAFADDSDDNMEPLYVDGKDTLYFIARPSAKADTSELMRMDLSASEPAARSVMALDGYDFSGRMVQDAQGRLVGIHYLTDAVGSYWFDSKIAALQKKIDALMPASNNRIDCGACDGAGMMLITSSSDRQPATYYLYDTTTNTLDPLGSSRPWIDPSRMATRDMIRIKARDGLEFPVHVTRPMGVKGPAPMVVLVHGGPYVRGGEWQWEPMSQFLASRGYVVVEPEYRGSTGFGAKLFRAGWKQWGLGMQDDIADATRWAIDQGYADPKHVCIAGASYGGYATLMGLIRYPELYRCGFEWVGVTDIDLMYSISWSDSSDVWKTYGMPKLVADRQADAAQIAATSPLKLADKIKQPLLMAYGGADQRVPIEHGKQLRDRLKDVNANVEWIVYPSEGHGWLLEANDVDFWTRVERFLDKNLKGDH